MVCVDSLEAVGSRAVCQSSSIYTAQLLHFSLPKTTTCALSDCQCRVKGPSTNIVALSQFQFDMVWQLTFIPDDGCQCEHHVSVVCCLRGKRLGLSPAVLPSSLSLSSTLDSPAWEAALVFNSRLFEGLNWVKLNSPTLCMFIQFKGYDSTRRTGAAQHQLREL